MSLMPSGCEGHKACVSITDQNVGCKNITSLQNLQTLDKDIAWRMTAFLRGASGADISGRKMLGNQISGCGKVCLGMSPKISIGKPWTGWQKLVRVTKLVRISWSYHSNMGQ